MGLEKGKEAEEKLGGKEQDEKREDGEARFFREVSKRQKTRANRVSCRPFYFSLYIHIGTCIRDKFRSSLCPYLSSFCVVASKYILFHLRPPFLGKSQRKTFVFILSVSADRGLAKNENAMTRRNGNQ